MPTAYSGRLGNFSNKYSKLLFVIEVFIEFTTMTLTGKFNFTTKIIE